MSFTNTRNSWGWTSIVFHWLSALVTIALFSLGLWMMSLSYYSEWYRTAPHWHKSVGVLFILLILARLVWRILNVTPEAIEGHSAFEKLAAKIAHVMLYTLLLVMLPSGYFITTASGQSLEVFNWFSLPSLIEDVDNLEDYAGAIHKWVAYTIIGMASLHALGALKHHFIDKDETLTRMLGRSQKN